MKRIIALVAATLFTFSLTGLAFAEEPKKDEAAAKEGKSEKKDAKKDKKKDAKKDEKKEEAKPAKKKKEAAGC
ncbi:hypothetical protein KI809_09000 [Geobacter pelophilus]|uniref:Uncharacterized protein n=1 Tax=Geoanaerobacter pelophilus TaxID=60036 RepID=A0AAW4L4E8_9BACT|nr:hypothetical protein [Geoanaerobacter pelophilus]MBT0664437.1 hypothetical protein [Geoanaerobacter pelophilus]